MSVQQTKIREKHALVAEVSRIHELRSIRTARLTAMRKEKWVDAARSKFKPGAPMPCSVCGRYALVSHAHHIFPLSLQFEAAALRPCHSYTWLCPTHHYGVHLYLSKSKAWPEDEVFGECESEAMQELAAIVRKWNLKRAERKIAMADRWLQQVTQ